MLIIACQNSLLFPVSVVRLHHLESKVIEGVGNAPEFICRLKRKVECFKRKLEVCQFNTIYTKDIDTKPGRS